MKVEFGIEKDDILHIRYMYCKECRNYQFDAPCAMKIEACKIHCEALGNVIAAVFEGLEGIAWVPGTLKEINIKDVYDRKPGVTVSIYSLEDENEEV